MNIQHKFKETDFGDGFQTNHAILDIMPYKPEVLIIGTFNPNTPGNPSVDFFYGRNYFWPAFKNLIHHQQVVMTGRRIPSNGNGLNMAANLDPSLEEVKKICQLAKITFADLISEVFPNRDINIEKIDKNRVEFQQRSYDLINDTDLAALNGMNEITWTTKSIASFLLKNPTIKYVYFTRRPTGVWLNQWNLLLSELKGKGIVFSNIFTPSGMGLGAGPRMLNLLNHWIYNENPNFGQFSSNWLEKIGVNTKNFKI